MAIDIASFRKDVYSIVASIPRGRVLSYGQVAWLTGHPTHFRLVGATPAVGSGGHHLPSERMCRHEEMAMET